MKSYVRKESKDAPLKVIAYQWSLGMVTEDVVVPPPSVMTGNWSDRFLDDRPHIKGEPKLHVADGHYIVRYPSGKIVVMGKYEFEDLYEENENALTDADLDFITASLNQFWNDAHYQLENNRSLGDLEKKNLEHIKRRSKEIMVKLGLRN